MRERQRSRARRRIALSRWIVTRYLPPALSAAAFERKVAVFNARSYPRGRVTFANDTSRGNLDIAVSLFPAKLETPFLGSRGNTAGSARCTVVRRAKPSRTCRRSAKRQSKTPYKDIPESYTLLALVTVGKKRNYTVVTSATDSKGGGWA